MKRIIAEHKMLFVLDTSEPIKDDASKALSRWKLRSILGAGTHVGGSYRSPGDFPGSARLFYARESINAGLTRKE